jgi:hypothetical protein
MMDKSNKTLEEKFLDTLRKKSDDKEPKLFIYWNLFSILHLGDPNFLEYIVIEYKQAPDDNWWFINFHKALRQCDYFSDSLCMTKSIITEGENKRRNEILSRRAKIRREADFDEENKETEYYSLGIELGQLNKKHTTYNRESISGHLDSILHQCIRNGNDELFNFMRDFFKENVTIDEAL